jgi:plasmid stabilization system protein ParE
MRAHFTLQAESDLEEMGDYIALILRVLHGARNMPGVSGSD